MKYALLTAFVLSMLIGSAQDVIKDANAQQRTVGSFTKIKVSNAFDVYLSQGNETGVVVSASETEFRDRIKTSVSNGTLQVQFESDGNFWKKWKNHKMNLKVYISFKELETLTVGGACNVHVMNAINADDLKINLSGASDMKGKLAVKNLMVDISGASDFTVSGAADKLKISASGASDFKGFDLAVATCDADASGASSVQVTVNKSLTAQASGASDIAYKGDGSVLNIKTSGASSIKKRS